MPNPGLYPTAQPRATDSEAEHKVHAALGRGLPKGWYAWHSLRIKDGYGIDGEGDFVIAVPERGMLVLEVKGGQLQVRDGCWYQNGQRMKKAPREQALTFANKLMGRLGKEGCRPPAFGVATCFPDMAFGNQPAPDDVAGRALGMQDLDWLGDALPAVVERALPPAGPDRGQWVNTLHRLWGETWVARPSLGTAAKLAEADRVALDAAQLAILDAIADNDRMLVEGGAGTGKSLVALQAGRRFAAEGGRVLLLCFTAALADALRASCGDTNMQVNTVRGLAKSLLEEAGQDVGDLSKSETWEEHPWRATDVLEASAPRWDAVVVDEAQDLTLGDWALIEKCAEGGKLWVFRDPAQSFWPDRELPEGLTAARFKLTKCYRTPPELKALADGYARGAEDGGLARAAVEADQLAVVGAPSEGAVAKKIGTEIDKLLGQGLKPSDIAIVSLRGQSSAESVTRLDRQGSHRLVRANAADAGEHIVADTFLRFKGLERPAIIVTDLRLLQDRADAGVRMHIALTRALLTARVVAPAEVLRGDGLLAGCG